MTDYPLIASIRDVVIIVVGVLWILAAAVFIAIMLMIYSGIKPALRSLRTTTANAQVTTTMVTNSVVKPLIRLVSITRGLRVGMRRARVLMKGRPW
ncbi:MAG: hypothetical protein QF652_08075 [Dehalococcoidia bacterium]|nr:hypothetical protein [Dehalococcoidia bacterium]